MNTTHTITTDWERIFAYEEVDSPDESAASAIAVDPAAEPLPPRGTRNDVPVPIESGCSRRDFMHPFGSWPEDTMATTEASDSEPIGSFEGDFVLLLEPSDLPPVPFRLAPWIEVGDAAKYLGWLQADIRRGARSPRARTGALQADLALLRSFLLARSGTNS